MHKLPLRGPAFAVVPTLLLLVFTFIIATAPSGVGAVALADQVKLHQSLAQLRMPFIANQGQQSPDVAFSANLPWGTAFVSRSGELAYLVSAKDEKLGARFVKERMIGAAPAVVQGEQRLPTAINFISGSDPAQSQRGVPGYQRVSLGAVYPGIEVKVQASANNIEKLFFIDAHADASLIRLRPAGVQGLKLNPNGELELKTSKGPVIFTKPLAYQEQDGDRVYVDVAYRVAGKDYGFKLGAYDAAKPLVIDPILASASLGGSANDSVSGMAIDAAGNVFVSGITSSTNLFATPGAFGPYPSGGFVAKLSADLTTVVALTYLVGTGKANAIALDSAGAVFVAGNTSYNNFPMTAGAYQRVTVGKDDVFILKLNADLTTLLGGTYLGGSSNDFLYALVVDAQDNVYVGGTTASANFPITAGAMDASWGGGRKYVSRFYNYSWADGFAAKLDNGLTSLLASTFIGGSKGDEAVRRMALDSQGNVLVMGVTGSADFPTTAGAYDRSYNGGSTLTTTGFPWGDVFVLKVNSNLSQLLAGTYLGGSDRDYGWALAVDAQDNVYVGGETYSGNFPVTPGVLDAAGPSDNGITEGFISKFSPDLATLSASTFLGGSGGDIVAALAFDSVGNVHAVGNTSSFDFPKTAGTLQVGIDSFAARMNSQLNTLFESELLGSGDDDSLGLIAFGPDGSLYAAGYTSFNYGSTVSDARIVKLGAVDLSINLVDAPDPLASGNPLTYTLTVTNSGIITATGITLTQTLPDHTNFISATPDQGACSYVAGTGGQAGTVSCTLGTLVGGASTTVSVVIVPTDSGLYSSSATVSSLQGDSNLANNSATAQTTVGGAPGSVDMSLTLSDSPDPASAGAPLTYTASVSNNSANAASGVTLSDTLPPGVSFVSASASQGVCAETAGVVNCNLGAMAGNGSATVSIVVQASAAGNIGNSATVSAAEPDANPANNSASTTTSVLVLADLAVTQSAAPNPASVGADLSYSIGVSNNGPGAATVVNLADVLPLTVTVVSATPSQGSCSQAGGVLNCALGTLAGGAGATVALVVTPTTPGVTLTNTASVAGAETDPNATNNAATLNVAVGGASFAVDVAVEFVNDYPDPVTVGQPLGYTARITNYNTGAPTAVVVEDVLPAGVSFVSANYDGVPCTHNTGVVRCEGTVFVSPSYLSLSVIPNVPGTIVNTVTVSSAVPDFNLANNTLSTSTTVAADTTPADVSVALSGPATGNVGVAMTYNASIGNAGPGNATGAVLTYALPAGMSLSSATPSQGSCGLAAGVVSCQLGTLAPNATATVAIAVVPTGDGGFTQKVNVGSTKADPNAINNAAEVDTEVF